MIKDNCAYELSLYSIASSTNGIWGSLLSDKNEIVEDSFMQHGSCVLSHNIFFHHFGCYALAHYRCDEGCHFKLTVKTHNPTENLGVTVKN